MKLLGTISPIQSRWKGQHGISVFHLEAKSIQGLPDDVEAGDGPLRVRVNQRMTTVSGKVEPGKNALVEGTLALNEIYSGRHLPPHIDATLVKVTP